MELLREVAEAGYPADYVTARVRGRRAALITDWQGVLAHGLPPGTSDESIWESLLEELEWLHRQMDRSLRECFASVFVLFELKTIVLCLGNRALEQSSAIERLLARSLLADSLQRILRQEADVRAAVVALGQTLAGIADEFGAPAPAYAEEGLRGLEDSLTRGYLRYVARIGTDPVIQRFFVVFIDLRNVMILYKQLRWGIEDVAAFIPGGNVEPSRFEQTAMRQDHAGLEALVKEVTGVRDVPPAASEGALETVLLRSLTRELRRRGRRNEEVALILDYLWRAYIQARNLALLCHGRDLEATTLERELIL